MANPSFRQTLYGFLRSNNKLTLPFDQFSRAIEDPDVSEQVYKELASEGQLSISYDEFESLIAPTDTFGRMVKLGLKRIPETADDFVNGLLRLPGINYVYNKLQDMSVEEINKLNDEEKALVGQFLASQYGGSGIKMRPELKKLIDEHDIIKRPLADIEEAQGSIDYERSFFSKATFKKAIASIPSSIVMAMLTRSAAGMAVLTLTEAEQMWQHMDEYEEATGEKISQGYKLAAPIIIGAMVSQLEKLSTDKLLDLFKSYPNVAQRAIAYMLSIGTEASTEALQQFLVEATEAGYDPKPFLDMLPNILESAKVAAAQSIIMGAGANVVGFITEQGSKRADEITRKQLGKEASAMLVKAWEDRQQASLEEAEAHRPSYMRNLSYEIDNPFSEERLITDLAARVSTPDNLKTELDKLITASYGTNQDIIGRSKYANLPSWVALKHLFLPLHGIVGKAPAEVRSVANAIIDASQTAKYMTYVNDIATLEKIFGEEHLPEVVKPDAGDVSLTPWTKAIRKRRKAFAEAAAEYFNFIKIRDTFAQKGLHVQKKLDSLHKRLDDYRAKLAEIEVELSKQATPDKALLAQKEKVQKGIEILQDRYKIFADRAAKLTRDGIAYLDAIDRIAQIEAGPNGAKLRSLYDWLRSIRNDLVEAKRRIFVLNNFRHPAQSAAFLSFIDKVNIYDMNRNEIRQEARAFFQQFLDSAPEAASVSDDFAGSFVDKMVTKVIQFLNLDSWGKKGYLPKIERGSWKVFDATRHVVAVRETRAKAREAAEALKKEGKIKGDYTIEAEFHKPLNPLAINKGILQGDPNFYETLMLYSIKARRFISVEPIRAAWGKIKELDESKVLFNQRIREIFDSSLEQAKGDYYSIIDKMVFDHISRFLGLRPNMWARGTKSLRRVMAVAKLGYRPISGIINWVDGHISIETVFGKDRIKEAYKWLHSEVGKRVIKSEEKILGVDFATSSYSDSVFKRDENLAKRIFRYMNPLFTHNWAEPINRKLAFATAYLHSVDQGMTEIAARAEARRFIKFSQGIYDAAALPYLLQGSTRKMIGQFLPFLANKLAYFSNLTPKQKIKYACWQMALSGPKGAVLMLKSVPLLGLLGFWDDVEEWLQAKTTLKGGEGLYGGVPNMPVLGIDVSGAMTPQIDQTRSLSIEDHAGAGVAAIIDVVRTLSLERPQAEDLNEAIKRQVVFYKNFNAALDLIYSNDGWIRSPYSGKKVYKPGSRWEALLLATGVQPVEVSSRNTAERLLYEASMENKKKQERALEIFSREIEKGTISDRTIDMLNATGAFDKMSREATRAVLQKNLSPESRVLLRLEVQNLKRTLNLIHIFQEKKQSRKTAK